MLYTVSEVAKICKTDVHRIYQLIKSGLLPALKLGSLTVREESLREFLSKYDGYDLQDVENITKLNITEK